MSQTFLDGGQTVGYNFEEKFLVVTLTEKIAKKMLADGWRVGQDPELGYFIKVALEE